MVGELIQSEGKLRAHVGLPTHPVFVFDLDLEIFPAVST
jgi:hypothetical protein